MQHISCALRASVAAIGVALSAGFSAPNVQAEVPTVHSDSVLIARYVKGANAGTQRVQRDSRIARRYFATSVSAVTNSGHSPFCLGTKCVKTTTCYDLKGALGAGCISA